MDAHAHLTSLSGRVLKTLSGRPNTILRIEGDKVIVATERSPSGTPVEIAAVQDALDMLDQHGEVALDVALVGYRSAFIGAVLSELPGARTARAPARVIRTPEPDA